MCIVIVYIYIIYEFVNCIFVLKLYVVINKKKYYNFFFNIRDSLYVKRNEM